ncbi:glycosyltransferase family 2 protein [Arthrobacter sp. ISL-95]|uniref:glycosyltransferase family 2 protein n=1 Tax=Arthrobacter sp. ISL-95 TaxID=2819116 RepID=UPI001BEC85E0|nr:glycosyltransferase family 2 protein [Arthrobacter sp. ISL-95]MBT2586303.1 glycosyltransferase family 2 protein [Arthrobacter sp. ISL-95]
MSEELRVSVIIPSYNSAAFVVDALESVFAQTRPADEIIVVNDGSTDETERVLRPYLDRVVVLNQKNAGLSGARNSGIARATGDWLAFLDADDVWLPEKLARQISFIQDDATLVCIHTNFSTFGNQSESPPPFPAFLAGRHDAQTLLKGDGWICPSSALVRRTVLARFKEWAPPAEDVIYFCELTFEGSFLYIADPLVGRRIHHEQATKQEDSIMRGTLAELRWVREMEAAEEVRNDLERVFFMALTDVMALSKIKGHWRSYWTWRVWLQQNWPPHITRPKVMDERISPSFIFRTVTHNVGRLGSRLKSSLPIAASNKS